MRLYSYLLLWLSYTCCINCLSQPVVNYQQFTSENGLSENVVYCLHKDKKGFIWAGTDYGLNRFDGYSFKKYFNKPDDSTSLSNHSILSIDEDSEGNFWIVTYKSLNYFYPATGKAETVILPGKNKTNLVQKVVPLTNNNVLVLVNSRESYIYNHDKKLWSEVMADSNVSMVNFELFRLPGNRKAVFGTVKNQPLRFVLILNEQQFKWELHSLSSVFPFFKEKRPDTYYEFNGLHFVYTITQQSFSVYNSAGIAVAELPQSLQQMQYGIVISDVEQVDSLTYWIATNKGLLVYDAAAQTISEATLVGDSRSLPGNKELRCLLNDGKGSIWIGIFGEGMLRCQVLKSPFKNIPLPELTGQKFLRMIFGLYKWSDEEVAAETGFKNFIILKNGEVVNRITADELKLEQMVKVTTGKTMNELSDFQYRQLKDWYEKGELYPYRFILTDDTSVIYTQNRFTLYQPHDTVKTDIELPGNYLEFENNYWIPGFNGLFCINKNNFKI